MNQNTIYRTALRAQKSAKAQLCTLRSKIGNLIHRRAAFLAVIWSHHRMQPSDLEPSSHSTPRSAEWFPRQPRRRLRCKAMFQMLGVFAEFERSIIWERVRAGLARAKGEGKRLGRPPIPAKLENAIREALNKPGRPGVRKIAERSGIDPGTVQRISRPRAFADGAASAVV